MMVTGGLCRGVRSWGLRHCALGALDAAFMYRCNDAYIQAAQTLSDILPPELPFDEYNRNTPSKDAVVRIAAWNNMVAKDADEVAAMMIRAAEILDMETEVNGRVDNQRSVDLVEDASREACGVS